METVKSQLVKRKTNGKGLQACVRVHEVNGGGKVRLAEENNLTTHREGHDICLEDL